MRALLSASPWLTAQRTDRADRNRVHRVFNGFAPRRGVYERPSGPFGCRTGYLGDRISPSVNRTGRPGDGTSRFVDKTNHPGDGTPRSVPRTNRPGTRFAAPGRVPGQPAPRRGPRKTARAGQKGRYRMANNSDWLPGRREQQLGMAQNWLTVLLNQSGNPWNIPPRTNTNGRCPHRRH
jgi:hypothetical protein